MYFVYILTNASGRKYIGFSEDLKSRLQRHVEKGVKTTKSYEGTRLEFYAAFRNKAKALVADCECLEQSG